MTAAARGVESSERAFSGESVNRPRILALDLSLRSTGVCRNGALSTLVPKGLTGMARLIWIRAKVLDLCTDSADNPTVDLAVLEHYAFSAHAAYAHELGELGGVVRIALVDYGVRYVDVNVSTLKTFACGKGSAKKEQMLGEAIRKLGYSGHSPDEVDALFLYHCALAHYTGTATNEKQRDALKKIAWPTMGES